MATKKTKQDVEQQSAKDRLWDSLDYSYGKKQEQSDKSYDSAISKQDNAMMKRGMQRSSYGAQTRANMLNQKAEARNDIESEKIANYQSGLTSLEQQEKEDERWERQFAAGREDAQWNKEFQQKQYDASRSDTAWNQAFQQKQFDANQEQNAWQRGMTEKQYADSRADTAWNQAFQQKQYDASRADTAWQQNFQTQQYKDSRADADWQKNFQTQQYQDSRADTAWQQAFQTQQYQDSRADTAWQQNFSEKQWQAQQDQWREQFDYSKMSAEQQLNYNFVTYALQNGKDVSDDMLQKAGLSRADFNAMKAQVSGGGGGSGKTPEWKALGFKSANDPGYLAYLQSRQKPTDSSVEQDPTGAPKGLNPWEEGLKRVDEFAQKVNRYF